ncbi:MarR family winged helix-turn-helix transcriptional regulator [Amphiplicatus metriothermophilus]|uniref:DNA-binding transcriptional regulator, MarR family n=1 Tax=Amphiplicatus metriothermophilus TaxID=1519374 RepID=A0A239PQC6_9PROT|nr:MarR family winged helix-turn-helix transcriptional regulator [Amphiplicatus metriothermophilus]MBB5518727.1 DNA-binding MarR family transcriptional regulator [Amphiplicatus metriothermophilus]SNT72116.1 DNA-binding transcriptional regulator, MarR family [Amphiplicatus metriothermophilus]
MSTASQVAEETPQLVLAAFLPYRIVALGHALSRRLGRAYADENLAIPEWRVLAVVSQAAAMAARDVAAMTPMDKMAVSRAVASLEEKGLVLRKPDPNDRRVSMLYLSAKGRALFARVARLALDFEARLMEALDEDEARTFRAALDKLDARARQLAADGVSEPADAS